MATTVSYRLAGLDREKTLRFLPYRKPSTCDFIAAPPPRPRRSHHGSRNQRLNALVLTEPINSRVVGNYRPISRITPIGTAKKSAWSPGGPSLEKKGLRFDGKVLRAEGQAEPPWAMLSSSGWSLRQHAFAPNPIVKFTVHLLQTASRRTTESCPAAKNCAEENHVTVYIELLWACARKRKVA